MNTLFPVTETAVTQRAPVLTPKRRTILEYLRTNGVISLAQATQLVGRNVYHNERKHTGAVLAGMVEAGLIVRAKRGEFRLAEVSP